MTNGQKNMSNFNNEFREKEGRGEKSGKGGKTPYAVVQLERRALALAS